MEQLIAPRRIVPLQATVPPQSEQAPAQELELRHVGPRVPSDPASVGLCAVWSRHAAELAVPLGASLQRWDETPSTHGLVVDGYLHRILPGIFLPPDLLRSAVQRALALGCALGANLQAHHVIAGPSAAWVVLGGMPPPYAELLSLPTGATWQGWSCATHGYSRMTSRPSAALRSPSPCAPHWIC